MSVIDEIAAERRRQIEAEGWTPEHDDTHFRGEMARAAAAYAVHASMPADLEFPIEILGRTLHGRERWFGVGVVHVENMIWPWDVKWWKPKDRRRDLIRAAALIVAEIERLDRETERHNQNPSTPAE